jgi:hypothetical protein
MNDYLDEIEIDGDALDRDIRALDAATKDCRIAQLECEKIDLEIAALDAQFETMEANIEAKYLRRRMEINDHYQPRIALAVACTVGFTCLLIGMVIGLLLASL